MFSIRRLTISILLLLLLPVFSGKAGDDGQRLTPIMQEGGTIQAVVLDGSTALVARGENLLFIPLLGEQAFQVTQEQSLWHGPIQDMVRTDVALYVLTTRHLVIMSPDGQQTLDVIGGGGFSLSVYDKWLIVARGQAGARVFRVQPDGGLLYHSEIMSPVETRQALMLEGTGVALADYTAGLRLVDVNDPTYPRELSQLIRTAPAENLVRFSNTVYVASGHQLHVIDVQQPATPVWQGLYAPIHDIQDMIQVENYILIADGYDGLKVYDLTPEGAPRYLNSQYDIPAATVAYDNQRQLLSGARIDGMQLYDASRLPAFVPLKFVPLWSPPRAILPVPDKGWMLTALGPGGIGVIDVRNPEAAQVIAALPFSAAVQAIVAHPEIDTFFYVTLDDGRLLTLEIPGDNPSGAQVLHQQPLAGQPGRMVISREQNVLAVASGRAGLHLYSLDDAVEPEKIVELSAQSLSAGGIRQAQFIAPGFWMIQDGDLLRYMALVNERLYEIDESPVPGYRLLLMGDFILAGKDHKITVLERQPGELTIQSRYQAHTRINDLFAQLDQVVVAGDVPQITVISTLNKQLPREQRIITLPDIPHRLTVQGDDLLILNHERGLVHIRFPLLLADLPRVESTIAGSYQLEPLKPVVDADSNELTTTGLVPATAMQHLDDKQIIGRRDGSLELMQQDERRAGIENLGGIVHAIRQLSDGTLLISAGIGGVWHLESDTLATLNHISVRGEAYQADMYENWLAVATGQCGVQIYDVEADNAIPYTMDAQAGAVNVEFNAGGNELVVHTDTTRVYYQFNPENPPDFPLRPSVPVPASRQMQTASVEVLSWQPESTICLPYRYEVWIDGAYQGTTDRPVWLLSEPAHQDMRWRVVVIDEQNQRISGPEWSVLFPMEGWAAPPPDVPEVRDTFTDEPKTAFPDWLLVSIVVLIGGLIAFTFIRRR